jgi:hypothetical protein
MRPLSALVVVAAVAWGAPAAAVSFTPSPGEQAEAIRVGARSATEDDVGREWTVTSQAGTLTVHTPFRRLAMAARQAAHRKKSLSAREVERVLRADRGRLVFGVSLRGARADFARFFEPALLVAGGELRAVFVQNEHTARREDGAGYLARCVYAFPAERIGATARVVLVVRDREGREVARFPVELAAMR